MIVLLCGVMGCINIDPLIAQLVEQWTVVCAEIHWSLVQIRLKGVFLPNIALTRVTHICTESPAKANQVTQQTCVLALGRVGKR